MPVLNVREFEQGESISNGEVREHLNELVSAANADHGMDRDVPVGNQAVAPNTTITRFRVKSILNDWLSCVTWDGTTEGSDNVHIAKPHELRHVLANYPLVSTLTTVNTQEVSATDGTITETWRVTILYGTNQDIWAKLTSSTGVSDGTNLIRWLDINSAGRAWAIT